MIDRIADHPSDPIARQAAVARSGGEGRRPVFRARGLSLDDVRPENASRRRSLVLDRSEHDGRLMAQGKGGSCVILWSIMATLIACAMIVATATSALAEPPPPRRVASVATSNPWAADIAEAAQRFAISERWIRAVMAVESAGDQTARSPKGAIGLMQIMPRTWDELRARYALDGDPWQPRANILAGAAYLREMHDRYGSIAAMLAAYNAGPARYDQHLVSGRALPAETVAYVAKIAPMIDGKVPVMRLAGVASRASWSRAPLFVGRFSIQSDGGSAAAHPSSGRPSSAPAIVDLSALVPPSDGIFVRRQRSDGEQR
ncbi:lytic transglycosylase domain-containing protein [Nitrobacter sp.]|uniref:lytic transglycosylase domain-containing protein n=1 Tax=Nitrobacter sp. TaxID=29420 RepID=UPI0025E07758|nr:lytic transglycosylase domain-containing protein [Nitrobacter sp.]